MERKENYTNLSREAIIKQPTTYTLMPKKVTLTGLKVFAIVMTRLQGFFNDALKARQQQGTPQTAKQLYLDFTPRSNEFEIVKEDRGDISKGDVRFTVKFKELGIAPKNYPAAFQTLMKMAFTPVRIPYEGKVKYTTLMSLDVEGGDNAVVLPDGTVDYIKPEVSLVVPRIVANRIFNVELMGYDQYFLHTALYSKSVYTFYIYVFLSGQWFRGNTRIEKSYEDFRAEVGLYNDPSDPDPKRRKAGERYKAWGQFCQSVLEPARKELDESVRTGHAPLSFSYEPLYGSCVNATTGRTTRAVTHIVFTILPAKGFEHRIASDAQQSIIAENTLQDKLARFLRNNLRLSNDQINRALREVTELAGTDGINQLADKANTLYKRYVLDGKTKASNLGAACATAIRNFIDNELVRTPAAEIVTDPLEADQARQLVGQVINTPSSRSTGSPSAPHLSGNPSSPYTAPSASHLAEAPSASHSSGNPSASRVTGNPSASRITGSPSASRVSVSGGFAAGISSSTSDPLGWRIAAGITDGERDAFDRLTIDLRSHATRHTDDTAGIARMTDALSLHAIHDQRRQIAIRLNGSNFSRDYAAAYYWDPADFDAIVAVHFNGYRWTGNQ